MENNFLQQLLLLSIGTTSLVTQKLREVTDQWVQEGTLKPDQAKAFVDELIQQLKTDTEGFEVQVHKQIAAILQDSGVPQQKEIDELRGRLDRLERQFRDLENRLWR